MRGGDLKSPVTQMAKVNMESRDNQFSGSGLYREEHFKFRAVAIRLEDRILKEAGQHFGGKGLLGFL